MAPWPKRSITKIKAQSGGQFTMLVKKHYDQSEGQLPF